MTSRRTIAVVGAGISGLAAAWLLARRYAVTLYEADPRPGGHSHTVDVTLDGVTAGVDTGFLVYNERTYPNLTALFRTIGVETAASDMSLAVRVDAEDVEWSGRSLGALFGQPANLLRGAFWSMLADMRRFNAEARTIARSGGGDLSLREFLDQGRYGRTLREWYLLPMVGAIWSCPTETMLDYPAAALFEFCDNHGLLQLTDRPQWRTVRGGSRRYVERLLADIPQVRLGCAVTRVARDDAGVMVEDVHGGRLRYDAVVLASHSDQSAALLADASDEERRQLAAVRYQPNRAVLHTDTRLLPRRVSLWSAWNFHAGAGSPASRPVCVSYLINRLQPLPMARPVIVSLNPVLEPRADTVIGSFDYAHPVFDAAAVSVRRSIEAVQGNRNTWFCGAWLGHGFHEDGLASAVRVARALGVEAPWSAGAAAAEAA